MAILNLHPVEPGPLIFTDDRAPIEMLTNAVVINLALKGFVE